ncbi:MAG: hypothetical protein CMJ76_09600 [Planctomycetaceae bacterium]|nr:hypothetical protein [Planctomycetaceae bacterium]|tara:strand:- start:918 stop:1589 length:672 start_codon:yes stop_codon:yes gene_type:complete
MKMSWRKFLYILLGLSGLAILAAFYLMHLLRAVPELYAQELNRPTSAHSEPVQELLDAVDDIQKDLRLGHDLDYEVTQDQINAWLATQLKGNSRVSLPAGIENPRVIIKDVTQTIYFTIVGARFRSAISIDLSTKLADEQNAVELKIESIRAGDLPIRLKRVFDEIESAMYRSGIDFKWKQGSERTVAIVRIPSKVRVKRERELQIAELDFQTGSVHVTAEVD